MKGNITEHIERFFGRVQSSWHLLPDGETCPFQILKCSGDIEETTVFCALGLSNHPFKESPNQAGEPIRHELLIAVPESFEGKTVPALLQQLGMLSLHRHRAFLRGDVIGGNNPVFAGHRFRGFYSSNPTFLSSDDAGESKRADGNAVIFVWMIPVFEEEIEFARTTGWSKLEDRFVEKELDLVELDRVSAVEAMS
jgi:hypothetical protein